VKGIESSYSAWKSTKFATGERRYQRFGSFALTVCTTKAAVRSIGAVLFSARLNRIEPSSDDST